ncbi:MULTISPECIES: XrtA/PEP-CTERM system-associated ATPase [unclassified Arsukibacterium]|uniref:XrtA/PEP-CTERM system-associated ATPase n=1 Tax=unclassified Arsukibacterium TaxID=2635278 RepID=UPI000C8CF2BB|nr:MULTISPECIES: XrtA/PEP-CTERM system-associated ATPase [unclassified Arsukibacterium]MAA96470.1 general secretion pathway protein GspA [Rheinheimera sp.]HAW91705.1 general secretion pathway protein GspA [Candidatus Azambacteria bacterium]
MYESYYGLKERPFQLTPNPNWFFASKLHKRALAYLQYGLTQGEGFIVITGDVGTGKTTIANQLLNQLNQDEIVAKQIVTSKLAPDDLIRMIASSFNLAVTEHNKASYLDAIYSFLKRLHAQHRRALLIVDEAQNLPLESIEELRMLSNFQVNGKPLLQSFLLGQNELNPIIQAPNMEQFRQRIIASSNLTPLQTDETRAYIEFRLNQAGAKAGLIADNCYPHIQDFSRGIPRKINLLMDRVMLYGYLEELTSISELDLQAVITELSQEVANQVAVKPEPDTRASNTAVLTEISAMLDSSLEQKVKLAKELDQLLKKQKQLLDTPNKPN